ncbi:MAG TPA: hypothetical protein VE268_05155 [Herpetosiphonaceae bacterium]|nr:hypothetical protein [Herpetosiphonaceae bacterium]
MLIKLATMTIDLDIVGEIYDYDEYVLLNCYGPREIRLIGLDAALMRQWLDEDWQRCVEQGEAAGEFVEREDRRRPRDGKAPVQDRPTKHQHH